jgi:prepilin-type N-terminal cleavage/methylation domain-containing protein
VLIRAAPRGFTLIELMLAMVMMLIVSGSIHQLLLTTQRVAAVQSERLRMQADIRGAALVLSSELRELATAADGSGAQNDIISIAPNSISYRAPRGFGYVCQTSGTQIRIGRNQFTGHRDPQAGRDSVWLYVPPTAGADSGWMPLGITGVSSAMPCTGTAGAAITISTSSATSFGALAGAPVKIYERMQLALYQSDGASWLGMKSVSAGEVIQPLFGPLANGDGFQLAYFDAAGSPISLPSAVRSIAATLRAVSQLSSGLHPGQPAQEVLTTQVVLRNASR